MSQLIKIIIVNPGEDFVSQLTPDIEHLETTGRSSIFNDNVVNDIYQAIDRMKNLAIIQINCADSFHWERNLLRAIQSKKTLVKVNIVNTSCSISLRCAKNNPNLIEINCKCNTTMDILKANSKRAWTPSSHTIYPNSFRRIVRILLLGIIFAENDSEYQVINDDILELIIEQLWRNYFANINV